MMFTILSVSDSDKHFSNAIQEYTKRLGKDIKIENLKPFKDSNQDFVLQKETEKIIETIQKKYNQTQKILLVKEGKTYGTIQLSQLLLHKESLFIIGGPYGLNDQLLKRTFPDLQTLSFGAITLPHGLAKLTLIEQLYRCTTLRSGKKYHY